MMEKIGKIIWVITIILFFFLPKTKNEESSDASSEQDQTQQIVSTTSKQPNYAHHFDGVKILFPQADQVQKQQIIEQELTRVSQLTKIGIYLVAFDTNSVVDYYQEAEKLLTGYMKRQHSNDGIILVLNLGCRHFQISAHGLGKKYLPDLKILELVTQIKPAMKAADYDQAINTFLTGVKYYTGTAEAGDNYHSLQETIILVVAIIASVVALISGTITFIVIKRRYSLKNKPVDYDYRKQAELNLIKVRDLYLDTIVTSQIIFSSSDHDSSDFGGGSSDCGGSSSSDFSGGGSDY